LHLALRRLDRRDWWLWGLVVAVLLLLCLGFVSFTWRDASGTDELFHLQRVVAVRSLLAAVGIFTLFAVYQQVLIKRLRTELAGELAASAALSASAETLRKLAVHDEQTGLYNRRFALEQLERELEHATRYEYPVSVLSLELDDFAKLRREHGEDAASAVVQEFARWLRRALRNSDMAARLDETRFLVVLPSCNLENARRPLARLHDCACEHNGRRIEILFSFGCVQRQRDETAALLLARADLELYAHQWSQAHATAGAATTA